jgi:heme-degrading monooxygenase HmoA
MIKRIVKMVLLPENEALFISIFDSAKKQIRNQAGCEGVELLRSPADEHVNIWTISLWRSEDDLNNYRSSDLFMKTWSAVKPLFTAKTMAWTLTSIETLS